MMIFSYSAVIFLGVDCIIEAHAGQVNGKAWVNHHITDSSLF